MNFNGPLNSRYIYRVAILVDWDNVRSIVLNKEKLKRAGFSKFINYNREPRQVVDFFTSFLEGTEDIYRIYIYTAVPPDRIKLPNKELLIGRDDEEIRRLHKTYPEIRKNSEHFVKSIMKQDFVAVRLGRVAVRLIDEKFILEQKQVDMLIGLDIAHLAYKKLVDRIIVFSYDSDIVPALKIARLNGIQIVLPLIEGVVGSVNEEILEHTDMVRLKKYEEVVGRVMG